MPLFDESLTTRELMLLSAMFGMGFSVCAFALLSKNQSSMKQSPRRRDFQPDFNARMPSLGRHLSVLSDDNNISNESSEQISAMSTEDQLRALQGENSHLKNLLIMSESAQYGSTNTEHLSPSDIETLRAIFESLDHNQNGCVNSEDFKRLHQKLGEELTDDEADAIMAELDTDNAGEVSFDKFLFWWHAGHKRGKKGKQYRERFKLMRVDLLGDFEHDKLVCKPVGLRNTAEYRYTFHYQTKNGRLKRISPWHDIPLTFVGQGLDAKIFNFICEIPKWTRAKFEIATGETLNPIKQDIKNGKLRFYQHGDMMFNYGAFPQTYENPDHVPEDTGCPGDNDPIDAIELGTRQLKTGSVTPVKVLGVLALLDSGETDWKVLCVNINDPLAHYMHDIHDVDRHLPGAINAIREFLRVYKVCTGSVENQYALRGEAMNQEYAVRIIEECHQQWKDLTEQQGRKEV